LTTRAGAPTRAIVTTIVLRSIDTAEAGAAPTIWFAMTICGYSTFVRAIAMMVTRDHSAAVQVIRDNRMPKTKAEILVTMRGGRNANATHETARSIRASHSRAI
jgi:hypothetical protein